MNLSNLEHAIYAVLIQLPFLLCGFAWTGGFVAVAFFVSREHAQRECEIERITGKAVGSMKPWEGFQGWSKDRYLDAGLPVITTTLFSLVS